MKAQKWFAAVLSAAVLTSAFAPNALAAGEEIVINDLAARLDMSPGYFSSMFKKEVHQSTMQYITGLRIERAREYLERTDQSVAVIAKSVGYEDSQYFFRVFKKATGMTPLQYRQSLKKAAGKP